MSWLKIVVVILWDGTEIRRHSDERRESVRTEDANNNRKLNTRAERAAATCLRNLSYVTRNYETYHATRYARQKSTDEE